MIHDHPLFAIGNHSLDGATIGADALPDGRMKMTSQPEWKLIANLGDANPIEYGGYFVYEDQTGVYPPEAELLIEPTSDDDREPWIVYRFCLDRLKTVEVDHVIYLVPFEYDDTWKYPVSQYDEWFHKDLEAVAMYGDTTLAELRESFCSESAIERAHAYRLIGDYHGFDNLDSYPLTFTNRAEVEARYKS